MGKADNIKKAKKLREAKIKRERDALIAVGAGPAGIALKQRNEVSGAYVYTNNSSFKYSDALKELVMPLMSSDDTIKEIREKFYFGVQAWNLAVVRGINKEHYLQAMRDIEILLPRNEGILELFEETIERKNEKFHEYKNVIEDFEIKILSRIDFEITVVTGPYTL